MKNKTFKIVGTIVIVGGMVFFTRNVEAQELFKNLSNKVKSNGNQKVVKMQKKSKRNFMHLDKDLAEEIRKAVDNKDYEAWKIAMLKQVEKYPNCPNLLEKVTSQEEFMQFAEKISEHHEDVLQRTEHRKAVQEAIANNDYETWKSLIANMPEDCLAQKKFINIENTEDFAKLVRIHELRDEIREIEEELGIEKGKHLLNKVNFDLK